MGTLYMIPSSLADDSLYFPDQQTVQVIHSLRLFLAERAKTARKFIKSTQAPYSQSEIEVLEIAKHGENDSIGIFLDEIKAGKDGGFLSEAGCPGIADPGAEVVALAHEKGIRVVPLVGPSSILLALMASGMNGQSFQFNGYLPQDKTLLQQALLKLESDSGKRNTTQIWIETPYRNHSMLEICLNTLKSNTRFFVAAGLTSSSEMIYSAKISAWKQSSIGELHKIPAIFLLQA